MYQDSSQMIFDVNKLGFCSEKLHFAHSLPYKPLYNSRTMPLVAVTHHISGCSVVHVCSWSRLLQPCSNASLMNFYKPLVHKKCRFCFNWQLTNRYYVPWLLGWSDILARVNVGHCKTGYGKEDWCTWFASYYGKLFSTVTPVFR